jgi:23S rRNA (guanine2445-N2)-methyltransferase / 23S rRNA (guanine2069-N7)-methyltransferase
VADQFRESVGRRPSVRRHRPTLSLHLHVHRQRATLSVDLAGEGLHRRGYRQAGAEAPLRETLAAGILLQAAWPELAAGGSPLVDPLCGSGTLPIEAALMAADVAPGLGRDWHGFEGWRGHDARVWTSSLAEARERRDAGLGRPGPAILGLDVDARAAELARRNVAAAGLAGRVEIRHADFRVLADLPEPAGPGLLVANPPYGERLDSAGLDQLHEALGDLLGRRFALWRCAVMGRDPAQLARLRLRGARTRIVYNGSLECRLAIGRPGQLKADESGPPPLSAGGEMFANRLRKNLRTLGRWARRESVSCYRVYDADMPEYALSVDIYEGTERWVQVQEREAPSTVDAAAAARRLADALRATRAVLDVPPERLALKRRRRQRGGEQYQRLGNEARLVEVREGDCRLLVNMTDYLDTGLFLDHRETRRLVAEQSRGGRMLNLFAYTGAASVRSAAHGAHSTLSVDLSRTYADWGVRNLALNGFGPPRHRYVRADCLTWLENAGRDAQGNFDLIFIDPPTFSNSKGARAAFDLRRDHPRLLRLAAALLAPDGQILFSTHARGFRPCLDELGELEAEDITRATIPRDFARRPTVHQCWRIRAS